jgi:hypothetical protein
MISLPEALHRKGSQFGLPRDMAALGGQAYEIGFEIPGQIR